MIICECKHSIDGHDRGGCHIPVNYVVTINYVGYIPIECECNLSKEAVEARYYARKYYAELQKMTEERNVAQRSAKGWEETSLLYCKNVDYQQSERDALQAKLEVAMKAMSNMESILSDGDGRENIHVPGDELVELLCEREGYGFVMDAAARLWARKDGRAAFICGPTRYMLYEARHKMRESLADIAKMERE